jgi:hypothetical protein
MALAICGQQNRAAMRRRVARTPGWCIECSDWKTASLCWMGMSGRKTPVETSPSTVSSPTAWVVICSLVEFIISATSGQDRCAAAIAEKVDRLRIGDGGQNGLLQCCQALFRPVLGARAGEVPWPRGGRCAAAESGRLKASATTFSWPGVCL